MKRLGTRAWLDGSAPARLLTAPLALQETLVVVYLAMLVLALLVGRGPGWQGQILAVLLDLAIVLGGIAIARSTTPEIPGSARALLHRAAVFLPVLVSYLQLRSILPAVRSASLDAELLRFDRLVMGIEPAIDWQSWVSPARTEWFAFFYGSYFVLLTVSVLGFLLAVSDDDLFSPFSLGMLLVYCTAHLLYLVVPGYGPHHHLAGRFAVELGDGPIWTAVRAIVASGGAQKDIFPSLHTAAPVFLAAFAWRHRARSRVFAWSWAPTALVASQIVIATMYLRWHWLIDVVAGLALAAAAFVLCERLHRVDRDRRRRRGLGSSFGRLRWGLGSERPLEPAAAARRPDAAESL